MKKINSLFMIALFLLSLGCSDSSSDIKIIKQTITRYNELVVEGYRSLNMNPMQEVATVEQATKLYHHMSALGEAGVRMLSNLKTIEFQDVSLPIHDKASAKTKEVWDFIHVDIKSGKQIYEEKDFIYYITYDLQKKDNRWVVVKAEAAVDEGSSKGEKAHPRLDRPGR